MHHNLHIQDVEFDSKEKTFQCLVNEYTEVKGFCLSWGNVDVGNDDFKLCDIDMIVASDIVYDPDLFLPLAKTLKWFLESTACKEVILVCTVRNEKTLLEFLSVLGKKMYNFDEFQFLTIFRGFCFNFSRDASSKARYFYLGRKCNYKNF